MSCDEARSRRPHRRCLGGGGHQALKLGVRVGQGDGHQVEAKHGRVDVRFANGGGGRLRPFKQITEEDFDYTFDTTARGTFFTVRKLLPLVSEGGSIILNMSIAGSKGSRNFSVLIRLS